MGSDMMLPNKVLVPAAAEDHFLSSKSIGTSCIRIGYRKLHSLLVLSNDVPGQLWQDFMGEI